MNPHFTSSPPNTYPPLFLYRRPNIYISNAMGFTNSHQSRSFNTHLRRFPQQQNGAGPNFIIGPDGQASFGPQSPPPAVAPPDLAPQRVQSILPTSSITATMSQTLSNDPARLVSTSPSVSAASTETLSAGISGSSSATAAPSSTLSSTLGSTVSSAAASSSNASPSIASSPSQSSTLVTTSAVASASATMALASGSAAPAPSNLTGHSPPFYIGVVLGTIFIISISSALIAWWVRLRSHTTRRRSLVADVPWAPGASGIDGAGLEEGNAANFGSAAPASILRDNFPAHQAHQWGLHGDRDVGEPKRSDSYLHTPVSVAPLSRPPAAALLDSVAYPLPLHNGPYPTTRALPPHLSTADLSARGSISDHGSACSLGPLQIANRVPGDTSAASSRAGTALGMAPQDAYANGEFGTPMVGIARPRFLGLDGDGLRVPWRGLSVKSINSRMRERGRDRVAADPRAWEHLPPLPMPGEADQDPHTREDEGWTASVRSNLVNAFNAVAAGLPSSKAPLTLDHEEDGFTRAPIRRGADRKSLRRPDWEIFVGGELVGKPMTRSNTNVSATSRGYSLEETRDGAGIVHFRGLEGYRGSDHAFSPYPAQSSSTLASNNTDPELGIARIETHESQIPLITAKKPRGALLAPRPSYFSRLSRPGRAARASASLSRASSVYSTASATSAVSGESQSRAYHIPPISRTSTMSAGVAHRVTRSGGARPRYRGSNSGLSATSAFSGEYCNSAGSAMGEECSQDDRAVQRALWMRTGRM
ncbi:hypothetical protein BD779DRAFT_829156 [Infundibulicybe gibba]|nr:hypothetical protein BD779DRAFT_829156 [Infundibulicybe gibba]